jgi:hypothetical protein
MAKPQGVDDRRKAGHDGGGRSIDNQRQRAEIRCRQRILRRAAPLSLRAAGRAANMGLSPALDKSAGLRESSERRDAERRRVTRLTNSTSDDEYGSTRLNHAKGGVTLMSNSDQAAVRKVFGAAIIAAALFMAAPTATGPARAAGACALVPDEKIPSEKTLQCGETLTVRAAQGAHYQPLYKKGDPLPVGLKLNEGALLIEYHPARPQEKFQILTPLAIAAVRGTKWAMEVVPGRTSTLVLSGAVAVTNRRLNEYVILTNGQGVDITPADTSIVQRLWGEARIRALLSRFGE